MNTRKDERWLDELITRNIKSGSPRFDAQGWKQKYAEEFKSLSKYAAAQPDSRWFRFAGAAAAITIAVSVTFFVFHRGTSEKPVRPTKSETAKSPAEMLTVMSLRMAYRRGGIEAVEEQSRRASEMLGPRPATATVQQLLKELENSQSERTEL
jgi:hypothetical protein